MPAVRLKGEFYMTAMRAFILFCIKCWAIAKHAHEMNKTKETGKVRFGRKELVRR